MKSWKTFAYYGRKNNSNYYNQRDLPEQPKVSLISVQHNKYHNYIQQVFILIKFMNARCIVSEEQVHSIDKTMMHKKEILKR